MIFGSYFLLNLILAVIIEAYMKIDQEFKKKERKNLEKEAAARQRKFEAIKTIYRMMKLF